jgi:hypothetical protein
MTTSLGSARHGTARHGRLCACASMEQPQTALRIERTPARGETRFDACNIQMRLYASHWQYAPPKAGYTRIALGTGLRALTASERPASASATTNVKFNRFPVARTTAELAHASSAYAYAFTRAQRKTARLQTAQRSAGGAAHGTNQRSVGLYCTTHCDDTLAGRQRHVKVRATSTKPTRPTDGP